MPVEARSVPAPEAARTPPGERLGLALAVIVTAQLMLILDGTIMNIALPSIQTDLGVSSANLAWVVTAYALVFGGLLLLGGRAGDLFGRLRVFRIGIVVFTLASLLGGLAPNEGVLIGARALQGVGAAITAPAALSLIATTFPEGPARNRAMGVYGAMNGLGSTLGLLLGGLLTEYLDWRWVLLVNIPIGAAVIIGTRVLKDGSRGTGRLDVPGALTGTVGLTSLVYGLTRGGSEGWDDAAAMGSLIAAAVMLTVFLVLQARSSHPMLPLRLLRDRNRGGAYATMLLIGAGMFAMYYFLTLFMQQILGYSAMRTGLAYLPFSIGMFVSAGLLGPRLAGRFAPRAIVAPGLAVSALGVLWFSTLDPGADYLTRLAPAMLITSLGLGMSFVPLTLGAVSGVSQQDAGIASAVLNTSTQVGGALGLAFLPGLASGAADDRLPDASATFFRALAADDGTLLARAADALTHGYGRAYLAVAALYAAAMVILLLAVNTRSPRQAQAGPPAEAKNTEGTKDGAYVMDSAKD
ncbi:MFS transporter [Streptomyces sp. NPDC048639]|uniref:MFS transporter n=1 Tax=Streptomyces sp. NPDC048639 TaxID=3365581 RepID=UPI0037108951